jgi:alpha-glucosidase
MGTRSHELAMYVLFDQPLGFLCDAPTEYARYPDILDYLSRVPTVWNKTVPLEAKFGEYAIIAKQTGNDWYVSGMTNWTERKVSVNFSFLPEGIMYNATLYRDSNTSNEYPTRYVCEKIAVTSKTQLKIKMAKGGGFAMRISVNADAGVTDIK